MNNWKKFIPVAIFAIFPFIVPWSVHAEQINSFNATYTVNTNGTVGVEERILYDFGSANHHGIYRTIRFRKTNTDGKTFQMDPGDFSVSDENGTPYTFTTSNDNETVTLQIGDANKTVTGKHEYRIDYVISGALTYFSDHDELYWNVTGNGWEVPISTAQASVKFPSELASADVKAICYTGVSGSTAQLCTTSHASDTVKVQTTSSLGVGEGLTIAVSFPKNIAAVLEPKEIVVAPVSQTAKLITALTTIAIIIIGFIWYAGLPIWIIVHWFRFGRDPKPAIGEAHAWFAPPKTQDGRELTPGETGTLIDEDVDMRDITATIVDLARRGYIKIVETKKNDFSLVKQKEFISDRELEEHEKLLLKGLFETRSTVRIKDADITATVTAVKNQLYAVVVTEKFFDKNPQSTRTKYYVLAGLALFTGNIALALIAFIFGKVMPRKTFLGAQTAAVARSLKNFLVSQERWMTGIAKNQLMFEKLLPYATAFGVEKIWAERFKDIAMKEPGWYQGYGSHTFTSLYLVNALSQANTSVVSSATPTRSSSGFSSGFSGGFSGGGGGGGGGGSW